MGSLTTALPALQERPLRRVEYDALVEQGVFEGERFELLQGVLVAKSPEGGRHARIIDELNMLLVPALAGRMVVRIQHPVASGETSEPEPDVALVEPGYGHDVHPRTARLVIEVALSLRYKDLGIKPAEYAAAGVPEYWVVDGLDDVVHVHLDPGPGGYGTVRRHGPPDVLEAVGVPVDLTHLLRRF